MRNARLIYFFVGFCLMVNISAQNTRDIEYIRKYAKMAVKEMHLYKIPASITLSQGILETGGGQSRLAEQANNHFGIKCKKEWKGEKIYHDDDARGECFRKYTSVFDSYRDHSKFLAERPYYKNLFKLKPKDYKAWAHGLKKAGYATNPKYAQILISRIKKYNLDQFDLLEAEEVGETLAKLYGVDPKTIPAVKENLEEEVAETKVTPIEIAKTENIKAPPSKKIEIEDRDVHPGQRVRKHPTGKKFVESKPNETIQDLSRYYDISVKKLRKFNDLLGNQKLVDRQNIFLQNKKNKGAQKTYKVKKGDTMYSISQKMGIKLKNLYKRNRVKPSYEPKVGEVLYLKAKRSKR